MRNLALSIVLIVFLSMLTEPLIEVVNVGREKITINTAINNSTRAAKDRSLIYEDLRGLDAKVDEEKFITNFSQAFCDSLQLKLDSRNANRLTFSSTTDKFNTFNVELDVSDKKDTGTEKVMTEVKIHVETVYKYKTKYLKLANQANPGMSYSLVTDRKYILSVRN